MDLLSIINKINDIIAIPSTWIFLFVSLFVTWRTKFVQLRAIPKFISLLTKGIKSSNLGKGAKSMGSFQALFTAMSTTLGMGNIVGPSVAIVAGGPGAIFWLAIYMFLAGSIKFAEVVFAVFSRKETKRKDILGGPVEYLKMVSSGLSTWYGVITVVLFAGWSALQANTLANIYYQEGVPRIFTGVALAVFILIALSGGVKRVGSIASRLVPMMCLFYLCFSLMILFRNPAALSQAVLMVWDGVCKPTAALGGFLGATVFAAFRAGVYKGIYVAEAGLGTASIAHAVADVERPTDQGYLAMASVFIDITLACMSGLMVLVTGAWTLTSEITNTLMYHIFKAEAPAFGSYVLIISVTLFVLTTIMGNSFNGTKSFASLTKYKGVRLYHIMVVGLIVVGSVAHMPLLWAIMEIMMSVVAVINLIGIIVLCIKRQDVILGKKISQH